MKRSRQKLGQKAVVVGGSMAGLLAARVLSDFYGEVIIIERDTLPTGAEPRKGVPQGQHAHALLAKGKEILETLFPDLTERLVNQGAPQGSGRFYSGGATFLELRTVLKRYLSAALFSKPRCGLNC